jgi:hypothetical protein
MDTTPAGLRPFLFHGLELSPSGSGQAVGECPFCSKTKFMVSTETGLWDCKVCGDAGNPRGFLEKLWEESRQTTLGLEMLAAERGVLTPDGMGSWGVARCAVTDDWLVPGWGADGRLHQLYRYAPPAPGRKPVLLATPTLPHGLFAPWAGGSPLGSKEWLGAKTVYLCEGPWDGIVLWETMGSAKRSGDGGGTSPTANPSASVLADSVVVAAPGANVFDEHWGRLFAGKTLAILYDSDRPGKLPNGRPIPPSGLAGVKRACAALARCPERPGAVSYLRWGPEGFDPDRKPGYDVRDWFVEAGKGLADRARAVGPLLAKVVPVPNEWAAGAAAGSGGMGANGRGSVELRPMPCHSWKQLTDAWRKAMKWTEGLDRGLSVVLACALSTETRGEQIWVKLMGPPSSGKTTLVEGMATSKYVKAVSVLTGLHSGYKSDKEGTEDHSLIAKLGGKTLVVKDGDTLLSAPNRDKILAEARDLYDGVSRSHYGHGVERSYRGRTTMVLCGTGGLRALDASELGARYLDCVIMEGVDDDLEDEIAVRVSLSALENVRMLANGQADTQESREKVTAKRMTGGYLDYLREPGNAERLMAAVRLDESQLADLRAMGKFVAFMRARPSKAQDEVVEREFSTRLIEQFVRLAACIGVVMGRLKADGEVMRRVFRVARDTARGRTLDVARRLYEAAVPERGLETTTVAGLVGETDERTRSLLRFMRRIGAVDSFKEPSANGVVLRSNPWRHRLSDRLRGLYRTVMID